MITVGEVQARAEVLAARVRSGDYDPEAAHSERDDLYTEVLRAIADNHPTPEVLAAAAVAIEDLEMTLWFA